MRPGKQRMELALGLSTALSRTPATQRSGVEGDPGPSARLAKRRLLFLSQRSPSGRGGRAPSPRAFPPRRRSSRCQRAGGAGRQGPAHFSLGCQLTWRPARRFLTKVLRDLSAVGSPHRTLALPEVSAQARPDASGHLPPLPAFRQPRRSAGRADQTAVVLRYARAAELALASRARRSRSPPAAGAAPVPP